MLLSAVLISWVVSNGEDRSENSPEIGTVKWNRDLDAALKSGKPVFLLFQEVPG